MSKFQVIGIDEAGRGPLAGPVVSAAVILDSRSKSLDIQDSKKISFKNREYLFEKIKELAVGYAIVAVEPDEIDRINILEATKVSMNRAAKKLIENLKLDSPHCLVDGNQPFCKKLSVETIIKGDSKIRSIGAASILAKVFRDKLMTELSETYPEYGFEKHMGYPTKVHRDQIKIYGPSIIHRKTFKGVKEFL